MSTDQIIKAAMALTNEDKLKLAEDLLASLDDPAQQEIDAAWASEIEARIDDLDAGRSSTRPVKDVISDALRQLK
jgi:putative addiction module component (TIGR02574 family)